MKQFLDSVIFHFSPEQLLSDSDLEISTGFEGQLCLAAKKFFVN